MMETESHRAPPSRYKSVRRSPGSAPSAVPASHVAPPVPQPNAAALHNIARAHERKARPLVEQAAHPRAAPEPQEAQHRSRFRRMLRLNTSAKEDPAITYHEAPPASAPPRSSSPNKLMKSPPRRSKTVVDPAAVSHARPARVDAFLALEGKKGPRPGTTTEEKDSKRRPSKNKEFDFEIPLWFEQRGPNRTATSKDVTAEELLEQVRPGHERYLQEVWPSLGLVRTVRYFENPKDIMNSWDQGTPTHLRVTKKVWGEPDKRLEKFPREPPRSGSCDLNYYNEVDRKWTRRLVNIENGSIRIIKDGRPNDKDYMVTISIENFDIYTFENAFKPDKRIRSPTPYCFALKSQYRESIFGKNSVFVHYFAADTELLFTQWHRMIRDTKTRLAAEKKGIAPWAPLPDPECNNSLEDSRGRQPLLAQADIPSTTSVPRSKSLHRNKTTRTTSRNRSASNHAPRGLVGKYETEVFSPGGLLGSDYEEKKRQALRNYKEERAKPNGWSGFARNEEVTSPVSPHELQRSFSRSQPNSRPGTAHKHEDPVPPLPHRTRSRKNTLVDAPRHADDVPPVPSRRPTTKGSNKEREGGFTGGGLVARGKSTKGHGEPRERKGEVGRPLVDMNQKSLFVQGSLLERKEREMGRRGPVIDRLDRDAWSSEDDR